MNSSGEPNVVSFTVEAVRRRQCDVGRFRDGKRVADALLALPPGEALEVTTNFVGTAIKNFQSAVRAAVRAHLPDGILLVTRTRGCNLFLWLHNAAVDYAEGTHYAQPRRSSTKPSKQAQAVEDGYKQLNHLRRQAEAAALPLFCNSCGYEPPREFDQSSICPKCNARDWVRGAPQPLMDVENEEEPLSYKQRQCQKASTSTSKASSKLCGLSRGRPSGTRLHRERNKSKQSKGA